MIVDTEEWWDMMVEMTKNVVANRVVKVVVMLKKVEMVLLMEETENTMGNRNGSPGGDGADFG